MECMVPSMHVTHFVKSTNWGRQMSSKVVITAVVPTRRGKSAEPCFTYKYVLTCVCMTRMYRWNRTSIADVVLIRYSKVTACDFINSASWATHVDASAGRQIPVVERHGQVPMVVGDRIPGGLGLRRVREDVGDLYLRCPLRSRPEIAEILSQLSAQNDRCRFFEPL